MCFTPLYVSWPSLAKQERELNINCAKKEIPMTNYSRFLPSNCKPHSHAMLEDKSGTVSDYKDIEPLVYFLGETKVNFESDVLLSLAVVTP